MQHVDILPSSRQESLVLLSSGAKPTGVLADAAKVVTLGGVTEQVAMPADDAVGALLLADTGRMPTFGSRIAQPAMIFGEPTSAQHLGPAGEVTDVASQENSMLVATHEMSWARDACSRTVSMEVGSVAGDGSSERFYKVPSPGKFLEGGLDR
ncbi:ATP-binding cassette domain-containing protein [Streptomyces chartreusis]|uniref:hypothetical protein n=1 Tax=Streptomyces chartreusis TaxID=1969 RepID=UPI00365BCC1B